MSGSKLISNLSSARKQILQQAFTNFVNKQKYFPYFGIELEFYLLDCDCKPLKNISLLDNFITQLQDLFLQNFDVTKKIIIEKEQGFGQIEIKLQPYSDLLLMCEDVEKIKLMAQNLALQNNLQASFAALPFQDDCSSALQFNISLHDKEGKNLFAKKDELFFYVIGGILDLLAQAIIFCAPSEEDYLRFDLNLNKALHKKGKYTAPVNICYGENNRTAALRIPRVEDAAHTRIEFRAAATDADIYLVAAVLLIMMDYGIAGKIIPDDALRVYGNAFDAQYNLQEFAKSLPQAQSDFLTGEVIRKNLEYCRGTACRA